MIYLGADHRGFKLKEALKNYLQGRGEAFQDLGDFEFKADDNFPDYAFAVAEQVAKAPDEHLGIVICGSGIGASIAANKIDSIRAGLAWNEAAAKAGREEDHVNVLALPADFLSDQTAQAIVQAWLGAKPSTEERYIRRINQIKERERLI